MMVVMIVAVRVIRFLMTVIMMVVVSVMMMMLPVAVPFIGSLFLF